MTEGVPIVFADVLGKASPVQEDGRIYARDLPPGAAQWIYTDDGKVWGLDFVCPCGCGQVATIAIRHGQRAAGWTWDRKPDKPTIVPRIEMSGPCGWTGYLVYGKWRHL